MDPSIFYRGVLFALRERREHFIAEGEAFHSAFREMLQSARAEPLLTTAVERYKTDYETRIGVIQAPAPTPAPPTTTTTATTTTTTTTAAPRTKPQ